MGSMDVVHLVNGWDNKKPVDRRTRNGVVMIGQKDAMSIRYA